MILPAASSSASRQFPADLLEGDRVVLHGVAVELWGRNEPWHGQMLHLGPIHQLNPAQRYTLRSQRETRRVNVTDVAFLNGFSTILFEEEAGS